MGADHAGTRGQRDQGVLQGYAFEFEEIWLGPGKHYFLMKEEDEGAMGWRYDKTKYIVIVTVDGSPPRYKIDGKVFTPPVISES